MTFLEIRQRVAEILGVDSTDTTTDANATMVNKLKEWVNARYRYLAGRRSWNWRLQDTIIQTVEEITTGTVTATNASTTITFSSGPTPSVAKWFIQFSDTDDWYEITSHTAAATTAVLANAYLGTTSSTLTYTLRKVYYSLPSTVGKILNAKQTRDDVSLRYISPRQIDYFVPDRTQVGEPQYYSITGLDQTIAATADQKYRVEFYPVPNDTMNINFRHYAIPAELSADGDIPIFPAEFHEFLVWDVLGSYGFMFLDDTRISAAKAEAADIFKEMKANDVATENVAVRQPFDVDLGNVQSILNRTDLPIQ